eukprot:87792_1
MEEIQCLAVDNGSHSLKYGWMDTSEPNCIPTVTLSGTQYVGYEANMNQHLKPNSLRYPIEKGIIINWDQIELLWSCIFTKMGINDRFKEFGIMHSDIPINVNSTENNFESRSKLIQLMFEKYDFSKCYISSTAVTTLYASGRNTGITVDCGKDQIVISPVYEGFIDTYGVTKFPLSSKLIQNYLLTLLKSYNIPLLNCTTSNQIISYWNTLYNINNDKYIDTLIRQYSGFDDRLKDIQSICYMALDPNKESKNEMKEYILPDGYKLKIKQNILYEATEPFFNLNSVHNNEIIKDKNLSEKNNLVDSIWNCLSTIEPHERRDYYSNIVISGGNSLYTGIGDRISKELKGLMPVTQAHQNV